MAFVFYWGVPQTPFLPHSEVKGKDKHGMNPSLHPKNKKNTKGVKEKIALQGCASPGGKKSPPEKGSIFFPLPLPGNFFLHFY
jgi:hypothetical protein